MQKKITRLCLGLMAMACGHQAVLAQQQVATGFSSSQSPYIVPTFPLSASVSILTTGDDPSGYRLVGAPNGLGIMDNDDTTFTLLISHELAATAGVVRAHGAKGSLISKWLINKNNLVVYGGADLIQNVNLYNSGSQTYTTYNSSNLPTPATLLQFNRFCTSDLPAVSAFYNSATGNGTQARIFMNGEEASAEGRAFAHIASGASAGNSYELPRLGKMAWATAVANPGTGDATVVAATDDAAPGQVYFYIGTKTSTGNDAAKAGLMNGNLWGITVTGMATEVNGSVPAVGTAFSMVNLGDVSASTGAALQTTSNTAGATQFLRPQDGAWDPRHPEDFYFTTNNTITTNSRLWKLHFSNINNMASGGTITAVLTGNEGHKMLDNAGFDPYGNMMLAEDPGNNIRVGFTYNYSVDADALTPLFVHDTARFLIGGSKFLTIDEEASGLIYAGDILTPGVWLGVDQAHYPLSGQLVEGGQLLAFFNPASECASLSHAITGVTMACAGNPTTLTAGKAAHYLWSTGDTTQSITVEDPGNYSVRVTGNAGCFAESDTVMVHHIPSVSIAATASSFCSGSSTVLSLNNAAAFDGLNYEWQLDGSAITGATDNMQTATAGGAYTLTVSTPGGGCTRSSSAKNIVEKPLPVASYIVDGSTSFCPGGSASLIADAQPYTYRWLKDGAQVSTSSTYTAKTDGTYTLVAIQSGCTDTADGVAITVLTPPVAAIISNMSDSICSGNTATLQADGAVLGAGYSYEWMRGTISQTSGVDMSQFNTDQSGNYRLRVTDNNGCTTVSPAYKMTVITQPVAKITAPGNKNLAISGSLAMHGTYSPSFTYQWYKNGSEIPGEIMRDYTGTTPGSYTVAISRNFCTDISAPIVLFFNGGPRLSQTGAIDNATSFELSAYPNPVNDVLTITMNGLSKIDAILQVMDMSGRIVAETDMKSESATINMGVLAGGLYVVRYHDTDGNTATMKVTKQ